MNSVSRKDFLRLTSLSLLASLLPTQQINALSFILDSKKTVSQDDFAKALEISKVAKKYFYQREYKKAEESYMQCIKLAPKAIRFYDGLENVFGAQGKFMETLLLYKNGLEINDKNVAFYDRTARALMRIEIGYKSISKEYKSKYNSNSMLKDGLKLYETALLIDSSKKYLQIGKLKIEEKLKIKAGFIDFRKEKNFKKEKRKQAIEINKLIYTLPIDKLIEQYKNIDKKNREILYFAKENNKREKAILKSKKKKSLVIVDKFLEIKDYKNAQIWSKILFDLDKKNQHAIIRLKKSFYGDAKFNDFINYRLEYAKSVEKVYAYLGVLDAIEKSIEKNQHSDFEVKLAHQIGEDLLRNWSLVENLAIDVIDKYNRILILDNKIDIAFKITEKALTRIKSGNEERINKILCSYANLFFARGNFQEAIIILKLALKEEVNKLENEVKAELVNSLTNRKNKNLFVSNKPIYYFLYKCYKIIGNQDLASEVLNKIKSNDFNDPFLLNKI